MSKSRRGWKWGLLSAIVLAFVTSLPQIYLHYVRGSEWNGSCSYLDTDELPYAAYTNALIDGRPRRNDPFTGKDDTRFETLFSIQFLPPYAVALAARILGISAATAFIILLPLAAMAAALVTFWLILEVTDRTSLAAVGAIGVLSLGTAAAHSPIQILMGVDTGYSLLPFLRRYIPALAFPIFLVSTLFIWRALTRHWSWAILGALCFLILIFSYFFLWTGAAAWLFTIIFLWFIARPEDRRKIGQVLGTFATIAGPALLAYAWLLTQRANTIDRGQLLELTHRPDFLRAPELYGALLLIVLVYQVRKGLYSYRDPKILFIASFTLAPFLVFNQQIFSGRSLQPFHYEEFVANYWVVLGGFLVLGTLRRQLPKRVILYLLVAGLGTAVMLGVLAARMTRTSNVRLDEVRAVPLKFRRESLNGVVFASDFRLTNSFATTARNPVLWSRYLYTFATVGSEEQKRRYYQHLYFSGIDAKKMDRLLHTDFFARWEVFGAERANPILAVSPALITEEEIANAVKDYSVFTTSFDSNLAGNPLLSYAVVSSDANLTNLDHWYQRSSGEPVGEFIIYRLALRPSP